MKARFILIAALCAVLCAAGCARPALREENAGSPDAPSAADLPENTAAPETESTPLPDVPSAADLPENTAAPETESAPLPDTPSAADLPADTAAPEPESVSAEPDVPVEVPTLIAPVEETVDPTADFIDLSAVSRSTAYAELSFLAYEPSLYVGKTIRLTGSFTSAYDEELGETFYGCEIADVTACCRQGLDFAAAPAYAALVAELSQGEKITVQGVFERYELQGITLYRLGGAQITR